MINLQKIYKEKLNLTDNCSFVSTNGYLVMIQNQNKTYIICDTTLINIPMPIQKCECLDVILNTTIYANKFCYNPISDSIVNTENKTSIYKFEERASFQNKYNSYCLLDEYLYIVDYDFSKGRRTFVYTYNIYSGCFNKVKIVDRCYNSIGTDGKNIMLYGNGLIIYDKFLRVKLYEKISSLLWNGIIYYNTLYENLILYNEDKGLKIYKITYA